MSNATAFTEVHFTPRELERFWSKVEKADGCWEWRGSLRDTGYGVFGLRGTSTSAHRASYLARHFTIGEGLVIDHLCRNRSCVNPDHLEAVTPQENSRRSPLVYKTHCAKGHEFSEENTALYSKGGYVNRYCLICSRARSKASMERLRRKKGALPRGSKTHCKHGHEFTPENTHWRPDRPGQRECITCKRERRSR